MATAKKCDRCGEYYDKNEQHNIIINGYKTVIDGMTFSTKNGDVTDCHDLCDECIKLLEKWLKGETNV